LGKSEVVGLAGNPLQAFGPALARHGILVLAPDSVCFEDRRSHQKGITPGDGRSDWTHHYNAMAHRLVRGELLMTRILEDSQACVTLLAQLPNVRPTAIGMLGHSYGGNTTLFHAAIDDRIAFACASGAACSYRKKLAAGIAIEMAEVIPGFATRWDIDELIAWTSPRPMLLVAGEHDPYALDAHDVYARAQQSDERAGVAGRLVLDRDTGDHQMSAARFERIVTWCAAAAGAG
jgi:dienelactone hydrolase